MKNRDEIIWAAGLFEGEGTICLKNRNARLRLGTTDEDVRDRFVLAVGLGKCSQRLDARYTTKGTLRKPMYYWQLTGAENIQAVLAAFWPWLGKRRREKTIEMLVLCKSMKSYDLHKEE